MIEEFTPEEIEEMKDRIVRTVDANPSLFLHQLTWLLNCAYGYYPNDSAAVIGMMMREEEYEKR